MKGVAKKFKSISELERYLKNMIHYSLDNAVKEGVLQDLEERAEIDVYGEYPTPRLYGRRGSLLEDKNYKVDKSRDLTLTITPVAKFNPNILRWNPKTRSLVPASSMNVGDELAGLINYGDEWNGYNYEFVTEEEAEHPTYTAPRPFLDYTKEDLADGMYKDLMRQGLEELGITVK